MADDILVSFVLATYNRKDILRRILGRIEACGLPRQKYEIFVVDNASTDGTVDQIATQKPDGQLLALDQNCGSCAKALAVPRTRGTYVIFLDDDSFPLDGSVQQLIDHFQADDRLGAAGFVVHLPDSRKECSALPNVFIGCGVGFRRSALMQVGNLDLSYFMQAEEYDLSFRLIQDGYRVQTFEDLHVLHLKTTTARQSKRQVYYDIRNNYTLALNFLPSPWLEEYLSDWQQRYSWLAEDADAQESFTNGKLSGSLRGYWRRLWRGPARLNQQEMDLLWGIHFIRTEMNNLKFGGASSVLFADLGKNIYPYYLAATDLGLKVTAILDARFAVSGRTYRDIPIVTYAAGLSLPADAIVISNSSPVHATLAWTRLRRATNLPVYRCHSRWAPSQCAGARQEQEAIPT